MHKPKVDQHVKIQQVIHTRDGDWTTTTEGKIVAVEPRPTGSWFAHGKDDKLWLYRIRLQKEDGELVELNTDRDTRISILDASA